MVRVESKTVVILDDEVEDLVDKVDSLEVDMAYVLDLDGGEKVARAP